MPFDQKVVDGVKQHMNDEHTEDALLIVRGLGGRPDATSASMATMDNDGIEFTAIVDGDPVPVRLPFSQRLTERPQIRAEVTRMYQDACRALGIEPREAQGEH